MGSHGVSLGIKRFEGGGTEHTPRTRYIHRTGIRYLHKPPHCCEPCLRRLTYETETNTACFDRSHADSPVDVKPMSFELGFCTLKKAGSSRLLDRALLL